MVNTHGFAVVVAAHVLVAVPVDARRTERAAGNELHKTHTLFEKPTRHQAVAAEIFGFIFVEAVAFARGGRLVIQVSHFRNSQLHAGGQFVAFHAGNKRVFRTEGRLITLVQSLQ